MGKVAPVLEIHLFGVPRLILNSRALEGMRRKNRALVFYIAANNERTTRENLLAFFWPDHERTAAQQILRTMIHDLRKQLGETVQVDDQTIGLAPNTIIDVHVVSAALDSPTADLQELTKALAHYKGDFLEGFSLTDSPQFDDWTISERERYRLLAMRGYARLAGQHEGLHEYPSALAAMRRALAFNPYQEDLQRDLMRLLYLNGDRTGVIRQYESLRKLLDEEMGVPPMRQTRDLYDAIINDTFATSPVELITQISPANPTANKPLLPFLGRDEELEILKGQLGSGRLILLEGEPGIGKTRLVSELIALQARNNGSILVLQGVAYELEQGLPYQPILDALRSLLARPDWRSLSMQMNFTPVWLTELARLLPELLTQFPHIPSPTQPADESRLWQALLQFFQALARRREVWLVLDDLHWADAATIAWLGYLIRHIPSPSLNLLATCRPLEGQSNLVKLLQTLQREDRLVQLQLSVLSKSAMQNMAAVLIQKNNEQLSGWLIENAEGNPFFLTELVRYAYAIGMLKKDGSLDLELFSSTPIIPATVQNLIESRVLKLSENARRILHVAAILGREFDFELVRQISSFSESDTLDAIEELQAVHLIRPLQDDKYTFDHSLTMQASLNDMNETRRHSLHRRVAETLEFIYRKELDPVSGLIAHHFMDGKLPERAKSYAFRAGQYAANLAAWVEAIAFYEQALALELDDGKRASIFLAMGAAHFHKGDFALASKDYQAAVDLAQARHDWPLLEDAHLGLNLSLIPQARFAEAIEVAKELRELGPAELAVCAEFVWGAGLTVESAHPIEAENHLREAERLLQEHQGTFGSKITSTQIKYSLASVFGQQGRSLEAIDLFREVLGMLEGGKGTLDTLRNIMLYNNLAYHLHLIGDASAVNYVQKGIKLAREKGSLSHLPYLYSTSGEIALANRDLEAAEKYFSDGLALAEQIPIPERIAGMTANLGLVAKQRGDIGLARERLQTALKLVEQLGNDHLEVRIRIWLAQILSSQDARACLSSARILAEQDGLQGLLEEIEELEKNHARPS